MLRLVKFKSLLKSFSTTTSRCSDKIEMFINGEKVLAEPGMTILQACALIGIEIPRYCYHERLSIAGNCRMCLVEVEKSVKPVASCAMPILKGMRVKTDTRSDLTRKAREGVTEFLLVNHPLDCPICDQAGECDLQDQTMAFGTDRSRFVDMNFLGKRAVEDKNIGPLVKTSMNRCIHCTKCIRFASEIAGVDDLGTTGRGSDMQVGTFVEKMFYSELSGNVIDLCPVGALTSKPYAFQARPWETRKVESIDVMDAVGSNIVVSTRAGNVYRILPKINEHINEEWISDKTRFAYDGLQYQRLVTPMIRRQSDGILTDVDWEHALSTLANRFIQTPGNKIMGIVGELADTESTAALKFMLNKLGTNHVFTESTYPSNFKDYRSSYIMNNGIAKLEEADYVLIIGCNPRFEGTLINARIRKGWLNNETIVSYIGDTINLTYDYDHVGTSVSDLLDIYCDTNNDVRKRLHAASKPVILLGYTAVERPSDGRHIQNVALKLAQQVQANLKCGSDEWKVYNFMHTSANLVGALDLKLKSSDCVRALQEVSPSLIYLLNTDKNLQLINAIEKYKNSSRSSQDVCVVYQGHHGEKGATIADIILPGAAYTEKYSTYVNTEGRPQLTQQAVSPPGRAREDWKILRALSEFISEYLVLQSFRHTDPLSLVAGKIESSPTTIRDNEKTLALTLQGPSTLTLPYEDVLGARNLMNNVANSIHLTNYGNIDPYVLLNEYERLMKHVAQLNITDSIEALRLVKGDAGTLKPAIYTLKDYYMTNPIARASVTMAKCVKAATEAERSPYFTQSNMVVSMN